jgi:hypothetical protein
MAKKKLDVITPNEKEEIRRLAIEIYLSNVRASKFITVRQSISLAKAFIIPDIKTE